MEERRTKWAYSRNYRISFGLRQRYFAPKSQTKRGSLPHGQSNLFFYNKLTKDSLSTDSSNTLDTSTIYGVVDTLYHTLLERKNANPDTSYTASLYHKGENTIAKKIVEEAAELGFAIKDKNPKEIIYEAADLLYHSLVGLAFSNINPDLIKQEIARRFGLSGIDEKKLQKKSQIMDITSFQNYFLFLNKITQYFSLPDYLILISIFLVILLFFLLSIILRI